MLLEKNYNLSSFQFDEIPNKKKDQQSSVLLEDSQSLSVSFSEKYVFLGISGNPYGGLKDSNFFNLTKYLNSFGSTGPF